MGIAAGREGGGRPAAPSGRYPLGWATSRHKAIRRLGGGTFPRVPARIQGERLRITLQRNFIAESAAPQA